MNHTYQLLLDSYQHGTVEKVADCTGPRCPNRAAPPTPRGSVLLDYTIIYIVNGRPLLHLLILLITFIIEICSHRTTIQSKHYTKLDSIYFEKLLLSDVFD